MSEKWVWLFFWKSNNSRTSHNN